MHNDTIVRGSYESIIAKNQIILKKLSRFLNRLDKDVIYKTLVLIIRGEGKFAFGYRAFYITHKTNPKYLLEKFLLHTGVVVTKYMIVDRFIQCMLTTRV